MLNKFAIIGCGSMVRSLVNQPNRLYDDWQVCCSSRTLESAKLVAELILNANFKVEAMQDNERAVRGADIVLLAVKPYQAELVCQELKNVIASDTHVISVMAGIETSTLCHWLGVTSVSRIMPNTPTKVSQGASGIFNNQAVSEVHKNFVQAFIQPTGFSLEVEQENHLHAVTAISGSGPAYFFSFMESICQTAQDMGLDEQSARTLVIQTCLGSAYLAKAETKTFQKLRDDIGAEGSATAEAIKQFTKNKLEKTIKAAMYASFNRSVEWGEKYQ